VSVVPRELARPVEHLQHLLLLLPAVEQPLGQVFAVLGQVLARVQSVEEGGPTGGPVPEDYRRQVDGLAVRVRYGDVEDPLERGRSRVARIVVDHRFGPHSVHDRVHRSHPRQRHVLQQRQPVLLGVPLRHRLALPQEAALGEQHHPLAVQRHVHRQQVLDESLQRLVPLALTLKTVNVTSNKHDRGATDRHYEEVFVEDAHDSEIRVLEQAVHYPHDVREDLLARIERRHQEGHVARRLVVGYHEGPVLDAFPYVISYFYQLNI
jgi:hypothetical protein